MIVKNIQNYKTEIIVFDWNKEVDIVQTNKVTGKQNCVTMTREAFERMIDIFEGSK